MLTYIPASCSHSQIWFWPFAHTDNSHLTHKQVQLTKFTEGTHQNLGCCHLMELNWLHIGTSTNVIEAVQWVPFWKPQTIRMTQRSARLSHNYLAQQMHLRDCSMYPAFNVTS